MKLLRDTPTRSGEPSAAKCAEVLEQRQIMLMPLAETQSGVERHGLAGDPGGHACCPFGSPKKR